MQFIYKSSNCFIPCDSSPIFYFRLVSILAKNILLICVSLKPVPRQWHYIPPDKSTKLFSVLE